MSDGILWRIYAQPREDRGWMQLVVPNKFRQDILRNLHEGITGAHLGEAESLGKLRKGFIGLDTTMMSGSGAKPARHVQNGNHLYQADRVPCKL